MTENEIARDHNSINRIAFFKKRAKDFFADYENPTGSEDKLEICLIRDGCRAVSQAEEIINRLQAEKEALIARQETLQKALAESEAKYNEAAKRFYKQGVTDFAERLKNIYTSDKRYDRPNPQTMLSKLFYNITIVAKELRGDAK